MYHKWLYIYCKADDVYANTGLNKVFISLIKIYYHLSGYKFVTEHPVLARIEPSEMGDGRVLALIFIG